MPNQLNEIAQLVAHRHNAQASARDQHVDISLEYTIIITLMQPPQQQAEAKNKTKQETNYKYDIIHDSF